ncbi:GTPase IMAP family member 8 isoform X2 [Oryzias melastigma]|uniref:GTPase IMAP family member 8 isoform X2 n=1 Tax=Oryzias melastigma TaxID=30732 RepID=UPI00168D93EA|nr:GTPase IMAP family member 8 isoform X2 [Oryzias melastigma]
MEKEKTPKGKMDDAVAATKTPVLSEVRLVLIGGRWAGKSSSANTILRGKKFDWGRIRTPHSEMKEGVVGGRKLVVVDTPGWRSSLSLSDVPQRDKQRFRLNASKCPPGPNAFLLVVPVDSAFSREQKMTVEEHMRLLGEHAWRFTMVLFTFGDFLAERTIEEHIESEGQALRWLMEKCGNRYHMFNNKDEEDSSQVSLLLEKIDDMVRNNNGKYYEADKRILKTIKQKQEEVAARAKERQRRTEEERQRMLKLIQGNARTIPKLQIVLLGSRGVGKTSVGNTILGCKDHDGKRTVQSVVRHGSVDQTEVTVVDTPGWWKGFLAVDTSQTVKDEMLRSMFLCPPGPHVFLLVIDADTAFNAKILDAVTSHVELLGEAVWKHTIIVFSRGDWLGSSSIEEIIEGEGDGQALQSLVEQCENRYHVFNNKNTDGDTQVTELLEKILGTVAVNAWQPFIPDQQTFMSLERKRKCVEEGAIRRQKQVQAQRNVLTGIPNKLKEVKIVLLGQRSSGKSSTGNSILRREVFSSGRDEQCRKEEGEVGGRQVTVIDTPGWRRESSCCTEQMDREIVRSLSLSEQGVHAVLLVVPLDLKFTKTERDSLEGHVDLFDASIWKHTLVLFTHGDKLPNKSIEEHIEREDSLRWLVDMCESRYHTMNNTRNSDRSQVTKLFEKIEHMVARNKGQLFCPNMDNVHMRISEKFRRIQLKNVLKRRLEKEYRKRELQLMNDFKTTLLQLQEDLYETPSCSKREAFFGGQIESSEWTAGQKNREEKEEKIKARINEAMGRLDQEILKSTEFLSSSMDALIPDLKEATPAPSISGSSYIRRKTTSSFDKVLGWLSHLQISTNNDNQLTLNFSRSSGYSSRLSMSTLQEHFEN